MKDSDWKIIKTLAENKSITKTAKVLFMTQPTLTKRLNVIERELGVKLVERNVKGVFFTTQGEFLAAQAVKILEQIESTLSQVATMKSGDTGCLRLGASNSFVRFFLSPLLKSYHALYPNVQFEIYTDFSSVIAKKVKAGELQVGFVHGDFTLTGGEKYLIAQEQAYVAYKRKVQASELPHLPQIAYVQDIYTDKLWNKWWKENFAQPPYTLMKVNHGDACKSMLKGGLGYGIFYVAAYLEKQDKLFKTPLFWRNGKPFLRDTWMLYEKKSKNIPLIANFIGHVQNYSK